VSKYRSGFVEFVELSSRFYVDDTTYWWVADSIITFHDARSSPVKSVSNYSVLYCFKECSGSTRRYFYDGELEMEIDYDSTGRVEREFYHNGQLKSVMRYNWVRLWNVQAYHDVFGRPLYVGTLLDGKGVLNIYSDEGELTGGEKYRKGILKKMVPLAKAPLRLAD
jgi:hypothetical protein